MAIFTRTNGDAAGVVNVDVGTHGAGIGGIVSTGIARRPTAYNIVANVDLRSETVTGGAVEAIFRVVTQKASMLAYQVENDTSGQVSVLVEGSGWTDSDLQAALVALGSVGAGPVSLAGTTVVSTGGLKLA